MVSRTDTVLSDIDERLGQRHRAEILVGVVLRPPALDRDRLVLAHRVGREPALQRGEIDERLERRAGLALGGDCAVELAFGVVPAADQRQHRAVGRHRHHRALADAELAARSALSSSTSALSATPPAARGSIEASTTMS